MYRTPKSIVLLLSLAAVSAEPMLANSIVNGSFESGSLSPWFQNADPPRPSTCSMTYCEFWNVTSAVSLSGTYSITDVGNLELRQNFGPIPTSAISQLGFWALNPNTFTAIVGYELFYSDNPNPSLYLNFFTATLTTQNWTFIDMTQSLAVGKQLVGIGINGSDRFPSTPLPRLYVDDVVLSTVPEPSSAALVGAGLIVLAALRCSRGRCAGGVPRP